MPLSETGARVSSFPWPDQDNCGFRIGPLDHPTSTEGLGMWFGQSRKCGLELAYEHFEFKTEDPGELIDVTSKSRITGPLVGFVFRF